MDFDPDLNVISTDHSDTSILEFSGAPLPSIKDESDSAPRTTFLPPRSITTIDDMMTVYDMSVLPEPIPAMDLDLNEIPFDLEVNPLSEVVEVEMPNMYPGMPGDYDFELPDFIDENDEETVEANDTLSAEIEEL